MATNHLKHNINCSFGFQHIRRFETKTVAKGSGSPDYCFDIPMMMA